MMYVVCPGTMMIYLWHLCLSLNRSSLIPTPMHRMVVLRSRVVTVNAAMTLAGSSGILGDLCDYRPQDRTFLRIQVLCHRPSCFATLIDVSESGLSTLTPFVCACLFQVVLSFLLLPLRCSCLEGCQEFRCFASASHPIVSNTQVGELNSIIPSSSICSKLTCGRDK
jgi:hypothetical protein